MINVYQTILSNINQIKGVLEIFQRKTALFICKNKLNIHFYQILMLY